MMPMAARGQDGGGHFSNYIVADFTRFELDAMCSQGHLFVIRAYQSLADTSTVQHVRGLFSTMLCPAI